jgi:hypothetical protein
MKQTRQAVCTVRQSIFLDIYDLQRHRGILLPSAKTGSPINVKSYKKKLFYLRHFCYKNRVWSRNTQIRQTEATLALDREVLLKGKDQYG